MQYNAINIPLNGFLPDMSPFELPNGGMSNAFNVFRTHRGIVPVPAMKIYNATGNLGSSESNVILAARQFVESNGLCYIIAGTSSALYRINPDRSVQDVSKSGGYSASHWDFAQYGDWIVATNGGTVQVLKDLSDGTAFVDLGGSPPNASYCLFSNGHLILASLGSQRKTLRWSAYENVELWVQSLSTGADSQLLADSIGNIVGLTPLGLGNYLIFTTGSIVGAQYIGAPYVFQFALVERERGALHNNLILPIGQSVIYWSSGDIYIYQNGQSQSIGDGIREWIFTDPVYGIDRNKLNRCACAYDENRDLAIFHYVDNSGEEKTLYYNHKYNSWTHGNSVKNCVLMINPDGSLINHPKIGSFQYLNGVHNVVLENSEEYGNITLLTREFILPAISTISAVRINANRADRRTSPDVAVYTRNNSFDDYAITEFRGNNAGFFVGRATGRMFMVEISGYGSIIGKGIQSIDVEIEEGMSRK